MQRRKALIPVLMLALGYGFIAIETFRSLDDFKKAFWNSPSYQKAIGLREGKVDWTSWSHSKAPADFAPRTT